MTMTVLVGSKSQPTLVIPVEGSGFSQIEARRAAVQFARARYRISDPIALKLDGHEAAVRIYQQSRALAPKMDVRALNGHSPMCFDNRYEPYQFD